MTLPNPSVTTILTTSPQRAASTINAPAPLHELLAPGRTTRTTLSHHLQRRDHLLHQKSPLRDLHQPKSLCCAGVFFFVISSLASSSSTLHSEKPAQNPKSNPEQNPKTQCRRCDSQDLEEGRGRKSFSPLKSVRSVGKSPKLRGSPEKEERPLNLTLMKKEIEEIRRRPFFLVSGSKV
ncbi:hypothetical protein V8G54_004501 [Vigna mungo]|uniref:Uncharacterized protein n=1 Tax=Vigna mungo TaxID=3915 RepID=A0AAQ3PGM9_VIGMU